MHFYFSKSKSANISHARIQEFLSGWVHTRRSEKSLDNVVFFFFFFKSSTYFTVYRGGPTVLLRRKLLFQGSRGGPTFSRGVQMQISIETHITCDFPGGVRTPYPPLWIRTCIRDGTFFQFHKSKVYFLGMRTNYA